MWEYIRQSNFALALTHSVSLSLPPTHFKCIFPCGARHTVSAGPILLRTSSEVVHDQLCVLLTLLILLAKSDFLLSLAKKVALHVVTRSKIPY